MKLYMKVTADEYKFPVFVGTLRELARFEGKNEKNIRSIISKNNSANYRAKFKQKKPCIYEVVNVEE